MRQLGYPALLCHQLHVDEDNKVIGYKLRQANPKRQAIVGFKSMYYRTIVAGDSYNDIQMFEVADKGFFINAPLKISSEYPEIPSYNSYDDLENAFKADSHFIK